MLLITIGILFQLITAHGQDIRNIVDNNHLGITLYSQENYCGEELHLNKLGEKLKCEFRVRSIRVLGAYELHGDKELGLNNNNPKTSLAPQTFWIKTSDQPKIAMVYPEPNYRGIPTYLAPFEVLKDHSFGSLRLAPGTMAVVKSNNGDISEVCYDINKMTTRPTAIQVKPNKCF